MTDLTPEQVADGWIAHDGGPLPVADENMAVEPMYRGEADCLHGVRIAVAPAWRVAWYHDGGADDIIAYREYKPEQNHDQ